MFADLWLCWIGHNGSQFETLNHLTFSCRNHIGLKVTCITGLRTFPKMKIAVATQIAYLIGLEHICFFPYIGKNRPNWCSMYAKSPSFVGFYIPCTMVRIWDMNVSSILPISSVKICRNSALKISTKELQKSLFNTWTRFPLWVVLELDIIRLTVFLLSFDLRNIWLSFFCLTQWFLCVFPKMFLYKPEWAAKC